MKTQREIKLKDKLWNGGYPMMSYEVTAVIKREKNIQYELLCESCNHYEHCRILITKDDNKNLVYVGMVNENDEDDFSDRHYYFHVNNGNFYTTKEEAEISKVKSFISGCDKEIEKLKEQIEYQEKRKSEYQDRLNSYEELLTKQEK